MSDPKKPLAIDLFCGLGGWTEGLLAEGYDVIGFDIERHRYPARALPESGAIKAGNVMPSDWQNREKRHSFNEHNAQTWRNSPLVGGWTEYPAQLVIQDVLTLHGSQFKDAALIVASPPCQEFSYMAMPWSKAKAKIAAIEANPTEWLRLCALFDACFRIQREACEAAGRHIPLVVENVRGAQRWVGRSRWNYGSFHLWGDVPALMPMAKHVKVTTMGAGWYPPDHPKHVPGLAFNTHAERGQKVAGFRFDGSGRSFQSASVEQSGIKTSGDSWFSNDKMLGRKGPACHGSKSNARKAASAQIAKIPLPLSRHIAATFR